MQPVSCSQGAARERTKRRFRPRRLSCSSSTVSQKPYGYGRLQLELAWLKKNLSCSYAYELRKLIDQDHPELSIGRQSVLLGLARSTHY
jgi:hypothetical protein